MTAMEELLLFDIAPFVTTHDDTRATGDIKCKRKNRANELYLKSSPVARDCVERENFFSVGDRVIFVDDSVTSCDFNGKPATVESLRSPINPHRLVIRFDDGRELHPKQENLKSSPVPSKTVQRENFYWVESYLVRQRFLYWRYCCIRTIDDISQVEKIHIPGRSRSIREGRTKLVRDWIAEGKSPQEIEALIRTW